jgi:hypothetical protein
MARPRPVSKKRIKEIEDAIVPEVETWLRLKAALDAVSTGNYAKDSVNPAYREPAIAWNTFVRTQSAANYIEVVYS